MGLFGSAPESLYTSISGPQLEAILREMGFAPELSTDSGGDPKVRFRVEGFWSTILFYGVTDGRAVSIQFTAGFRDQVSLEKVNEWNSRKRYLKAYRDGDGDLMVDMDVDLKGGVPRAYLEERIGHWRHLLGSLVRFVAED